MTWIEALILGIIQGLTEFLPVSSSGHREIGKALLNVEVKEDLSFTVMVHFATVLSTITVFFKEIKEPITTTMIGNYAVAGGVTQTDPDVICAFPITPQTQSVEGLSDVVHQGRLKAAFVNVESELAAISYSTAACAAGARAFTAHG